MVKINLVPRVSRKEENLKKLLFGLTLLATVIISGVFYISVKMDSEVVSLEGKVKVAQLEYKAVEKKMKKLKKFKSMKDGLKRKVDIIKSLKSMQTGPVKMLDLLSSSVPQEIWVTSIKNSGNINVKGVSFSNPAIADFMETLSESKAFDGIKLLQSMQRTVNGRKVKEFQVVSSINYGFLKDYKNLSPRNNALPIPLQMLRKQEMKSPNKLALIASAEQVER